jgi:hypothetical protein
MNLRKDRFWLISWGPGLEPESQALARVIQFGIDGTSMPGHEYLAREEIADLVGYVQYLRGTMLRASHAVPASDGDGVRR